MEWTKAPPELVQQFDAALPADPLVVRRKMFGHPCAFVNGNMFTGVFQTKIFVRLSDDLARELLLVDGAAPFAPMPGRPMKGYVTLPDDGVRQPGFVHDWIEKSLLNAASLPPKEPKARGRSRKAG